jgi:hypothetical protein
MPFPAKSAAQKKPVTESATGFFGTAMKLESYKSER